MSSTQVVDESLALSTLRHLQEVASQCQVLAEIQQRSVADARGAADRRLALRGLQLAHTTSARTTAAKLGQTVGALLASEPGVADAQAADATVAASLPAALAAHLKEAVVADSMVRESNDLFTAYRLAGRTMFRVDGATAIGVQFETCFGGTYGDTFFVFLEPAGRDTGHFTLVRHTLPYAVPVTALATRFLGTDVSTHSDVAAFLDAVGTYCDALVGRQRQARQLAEQRGVSVQVSASADYVRFTAKLRRKRRVEGLLAYDELESATPTRVELYSYDARRPDDRQRLLDLEAPFRTAYLHEAFAQTIAQLW
eukprot:CAMPEP_0170740152 /NCGR_PEP_ID=MMETSP0437-20130122/5533_1 /TAXON_ID=0 /ORGANISM="Sexangularia sp." /LENGTH=311 /DNA_ID=CAMNT_0011078637 /DNA_START=80 /DNA_END=1012 /DNA_ORIENTATION=+